MMNMVKDQNVQNIKKSNVYAYIILKELISNVEIFNSFREGLCGIFTSGTFVFA